MSDTVKDWDIVNKRASHIKEQQIAADEAFVRRLRGAVVAGRERATFGVAVDGTPLIGAMRARVEMPHSGCGSPSLLCMTS